MGITVGVAIASNALGPASATDNAIVRFNGTTGKLVQNSVITVGDTGTISAASGSNNTPGSDLSISAGSGVGEDSDGGNCTITAGHATTTGPYDANGGDLTCAAGNASTSGPYGGIAGYLRLKGGLAADAVSRSSIILYCDQLGFAVPAEITGMSSPTASDSAATKGYVDTQVATTSATIETVGASTPSAASTTAVAASQSAGGGSSLILVGGSWAAGFDGGRKITFTSVDNNSGSNITITGADIYLGEAQSEVIAGPNNNTVTSTKYYSSVSALSISVAVTNLSAGYSDSKWLLDVSQSAYPQYKILTPANGTTVIIGILGVSAGVSTKTCKLKLTAPATGTFTWANGAVIAGAKSDAKLFFAGGTEPVPTVSGTDLYEFTSDGTTNGGANVWYGRTIAQDLKA